MAQTATAKASTAGHSTADLMRAAEAMLPMVEAEADEAERVSHMTDKVVNVTSISTVAARATIT